MNKIVVFLLFLAIFLIASCAQKEPQDPEKVSADFKSEESLEGKIKIYEEFMATNSDSDLLKSLTYNLTNIISKEKGLLEATDFLKDNEEFASPSAYNSLAWKIYESRENLELGAELAKLGVLNARKELNDVNETQPENETDEERKNSLKRSLAMILDTYGSIEKELGNKENVLPSFKEAVELMEGKYGGVNENYIAALILENEYQEAKSSLEKFITTGNNTENMTDQLKQVFTELGNPESDFPSYLGELKEKSTEIMIEKLKGEIKNEPASDFELYDLDGKLVKLSDFKGKTVILDFWATWCGPCLRSFPGMEKAVEKFSSDPKVKFFFVNTWERVENIKQHAVDFLKEKEYPFHVLLDDQNKVVEKYSVRGIPTKFIIDKNQKIRFESIGFSGNEEELVEKLSIMISMAK